MQTPGLKGELYEPLGISADVFAGVHEVSQKPYASTIVYVQFVPDEDDYYLSSRTVNPLFHRPVDRHNTGLCHCYAVNADVKLASLGVYCASRLLLEGPIYFSIPGLLTLSKLLVAADEGYWDGAPFQSDDRTADKTQEGAHDCANKPTQGEIMKALHSLSMPLDPYITIGEAVQELLHMGSLRHVEWKLARQHFSQERYGVCLTKDLGKMPTMPVVLSMRRTPFPAYGVTDSIAMSMPPFAPMSAHIYADLSSIAKTVQSMQAGQLEEVNTNKKMNITS